MLSTSVLSDRLERGGDASLYLLGVQAGILPGHGDHRYVDIRENVGGGTQNHDRADNQDEQAITMKV